MSTLLLDSILTVCGIVEDRGVDRMVSGHSKGIGELLKLYCLEKREIKRMVHLL